MKFDKVDVIRAFVNHFENELKVLTESATAAHEAATHDEAKSEDKHDTRAIEASYLAMGTAKRVMDLEEALKEFQGYLENPKECSKVEHGALLTLNHDAKITHSFFAKLAGGTKAKLETAYVSVVTDQSPLGQALFNSEKNEAIEVETKSGLKSYALISIE